MNRAQALSKLNRSDMRNAAAERGMQRLFTWNRAHWIGMVVLIAAGVPIPFLGSRESRNIMKTAISCNDARADPSKGADHERDTDGTVPVARTT